MPVEGCSLQVLRACGIQSQHLFILLQPVGGSLPQTDAPFQQLCTQLHRHGHIAESARGNVASMLHGPYHQARPGQYIAAPQGDAHNNAAYLAAAQRTANSSEVMHSFLQNTPVAHASGSPWGSLIPQAMDNRRPLCSVVRWWRRTCRRHQWHQLPQWRPVRFLWPRICRSTSTRTLHWSR